MSDCDLEMPGLQEYMREIHQKAYENKIPVKGIFELTPRCNFNCNMCYVHLSQEELIHSGKQELTGKEWIALAQSAKDCGMMELTLTGGELFLHPDFREIYDAISRMGFLIQIFSNGFLWDEKMMEYFKDKPPYAVRFTLYGASDETYEKVCGIKNGFTTVMHGIELVRAAGIPLYLVGTVTKENEGELNRMVQFANDNRLPFLHSSGLMNPVRGASANPKEHQTQLKLPPEEIRQELRRHVKKYPRAKEELFADTCGNYRKAFWITWEGRMQLCAFLTEPAVLVKPETFRNAWGELLSKVEKLKEPAQCGSCELEAYCDRCPGTLYTEQCFDTLPETICARAKYLYSIYGPEADSHIEQ